MRTCECGGSGARRHKVAHCEGSVSFHLLFVLISHTQPFGEGGRKHSSVGPVGGAAITGLVALGFLGHAAGLIALTRTTLKRIRYPVRQ